MKLRDYINNNELEQSNNIDNNSYIIAKQIILLVKNKDYSEAMLVLDKNLDNLYKDLNLPSFCFLIDYYINNTEEDYLNILHRESIPSLLINLSKDYNEKNKMYFINKLKGYYHSKHWDEALSCVEILRQKTDIDKYEMEIAKIDILINLKRYEEALIKCDELLNINSKDEYLNNSKVEIFILVKEYNKLEQYIEDDIQLLNKKNLSKSYLLLAKHYELKKNYTKAYAFYGKASEVDSYYKIPIKVVNKVKKNGNNSCNRNKLFIAVFILILISISVYKLMDKYKINKIQITNIKSQVVDIKMSKY